MADKIKSFFKFFLLVDEDDDEYEEEEEVNKFIAKILKKITY